jgi:hypothetical protein
MAPRSADPIHIEALRQSDLEKLIARSAGEIA